MKQDCKRLPADVLKRCETAFDSAMMKDLTSGINGTDIKLARRQCRDQSRNASEACIKAQAVISDAQKYCSDKGTNSDAKRGIDWMANMVGQRCRSRSGASALLMSASAAVISSAMLF